jgi:hypothetical protein
MRQPVATLLCLTFLGVTGSTLAVKAEDPAVSSSAVPAFYNWLEKYQNPAAEYPGQNAQPHTSQPMQPTQSAQSANDVVLQNGAATLPSSWTSLAETANADQGSRVVGPGEGLGCYYHRSYYSHLPLFNKTGNYTLRGDLDVSEPYHQPSDHVSATSRRDAH